MIKKILSQRFRRGNTEFLHLRELMKVAGITAEQNSLNNHSRLRGIRDLCSQTLYFNPF